MTIKRFKNAAGKGCGGKGPVMSVRRRQKLLFYPQIHQITPGVFGDSNKNIFTI
jgi:hypothetical protein